MSGSDVDDAGGRLEIVRRLERRSAQRGAFGAICAAAALLVALGVVIDLEQLWLAGLVGLGFVGVTMARPVRLRLDWSDSRGAVLVIVSFLAVIAAYLVMQYIARSADWSAPYTASALAAAVMMFVACLPALSRLATSRAGLAQRSGPDGV